MTTLNFLTSSEFTVRTELYLLCSEWWDGGQLQESWGQEAGVKVRVISLVLERLSIGLYSVKGWRKEGRC